MFSNRVINDFDKNKIQEYYPGAYMVRTQGVSGFRKSNPEKDWDRINSATYFAQKKADGFSYSFEHTSQGSYLFGRSPVKKTGLLSEKSAWVPHIIDALSILPYDTILVGEIYYPGKTSRDVVSIMNCKVDKSLDRQKGNPIHYYIHDIIAYNGQSLLDETHYDRYNILKQAYEKHNLSQYDFLELADCYLDVDFQKLADDLIARGEEGIVIKKADDTYTPGKKPAGSMYKIKKNDTVDVVCMGLESASIAYVGKEEPQYWIEEVPHGDSWKEVRRYEGPMQEPTKPHSRTYGITKPFYMGWKNAIKIGLYKNEKLIPVGTVSSGISDRLKKDMTNNPDKYIGKVVECGIMEKEEAAFRHPVFIRFRDDKDPKDCIFDEVFQ